MATNISQWLKVQKLHFCEKGYFDQLLDCSILLLLFFLTLLLCHITSNSLNAVYFLNTIRVSNSMDPDQARHFVRPDLGPNCLQRFSADDKVAASGQRVKY